MQNVNEFKTLLNSGCSCFTDCWWSSELTWTSKPRVGTHRATYRRTAATPWSSSYWWRGVPPSGWSTIKAGHLWKTPKAGATPRSSDTSQLSTKFVSIFAICQKFPQYACTLKKLFIIFFGILLIIWLSESLIHSFIQLFGYLFDFKKTNFFMSLFPGSESYRRTGWESQITSSMQKMHMFPSDNGNGYYWAENPDHFSVQSENNLSLLSHKESPSKMTFRNL